MRIAFLGDGCSPIIRSWVEYFAEKFASEPDSVHLITANPHTPVFGDPSKPAKVWLVAPPKRRKIISWLKVIRNTKEAIRQIKPDIIHAHSIYAYGVPAAMSGFHPFVGTQMGDDIGVLTYRSVVHRAAVRRVLRHIDALFAKDIYARERALQLGCDPAKIVLMTSTCDTTRFSPDARSGAFRASLGIRPNEIMAVFTRPIRDQYRPEALAGAIPNALARVPNLKVVFLERGEYQGLKATLGDDARVLWIPAIPHERFNTYLASADMFIDTFVPRDGMLGHAHGTAVVEAMACGLPLVLPDKPEFHFPWFNAIMYPIEMPDAFAECIVRVARDADLRRAMGAEARQLAVQYFERAVVMGKAYETYQRLTRIHSKPETIF